MVSNESPNARKKVDPLIQVSSTYVTVLQDRWPSKYHTIVLAVGLIVFSLVLLYFQSADVTLFQSECLSETSLDREREEIVSWQQVRRFDGIPARDKAWYLDQMKRNNSGDACHQVRTASAQVYFDLNTIPPDGNLKLETDQDYEVMIVSYGPNGTRRCSGGDFFEIDINGTHWKARPPLKDLGDGSYLFNLRVHRDFPGTYRLRVILLYPNWHGLELNHTDKWAKVKDIVYVEMNFVNSKQQRSSEQSIQLCDSGKDFKLRSWRGRWTRKDFNESCTSDSKGRFRCINRHEKCEGQWCVGEVGRLESNGWVYSAHCAFRIFTFHQAWKCLGGKWIFFWGDSNHQDTIRNLLVFALGNFNASSLDRNGHRTYKNPVNTSQGVTITNSFNGHYRSAENNIGLASLDHTEHRERVTSYFNGTRRSSPPDVVIMNSGLHDGNHWPDPASFTRAAENASVFWRDLWERSSSDKGKRPAMIYRTTVAPGGINTNGRPGRNTNSNVQKHEVFNSIIVDTFLAKFGGDNLQIVDAYDLTFPWHYDHMTNDGPHYGRAPNPKSWIPGGHQYFVDVMLAHILLNTICPVT